MEKHILKKMQTGSTLGGLVELMVSFGTSNVPLCHARKGTMLLTTRLDLASRFSLSAAWCSGGQNEHTTT